MIDANQRWGVQEAIRWTKALASHNLMWIEEPTSPDDVLGHKTIADVSFNKKMKYRACFIFFFVCVCVF